MSTDDDLAQQKQVEFVRDARCSIESVDHLNCPGVYHVQPTTTTGMNDGSFQDARTAGTTPTISTGSSGISRGDFADSSFSRTNGRNGREHVSIPSVISGTIIDPQGTRKAATNRRRVKLPPLASEAAYAQPSSSCSSRTKKMVVLCIVAVLVAGIASVVATFLVGGSDSKSTTQTQDDVSPIDELFGIVMDGSVVKDQYGLCISMNDEGTRVAIASKTRVQVMEMIEDEDGNFTRQLGQDITHPDYLSSDGKNVGHIEYGDDFLATLPFRAPIIVELSSNDGSFLAVGWPLLDSNETLSDMPFTFKKHAGLVQVYHLIAQDDDGDEQTMKWEQVGNSIWGEQEYGYFGASLSMSEDGSILSVAAPGNPGVASDWLGEQGEQDTAIHDVNGYVQVFHLNKGIWESRGSLVSGSDMSLSVYSVSLSGDGKSVAIGGIPLPSNGKQNNTDDDGSVAKVFQWYAGDWIQQGVGIGQSIGGNTSYIATLSSNGKTLVVSNYFVSDADSNTGVGLDVRAFLLSIDNGSQSWIPMGSTMHANNENEKSGYFISISSDGKFILMGDPGRKYGTSGNQGHAHVWTYAPFRDEEDGTSSVTNHDWIQFGPNIWGEAAGDQFGYAVSISGNGKKLAVSAPFNRGTGYERGRVKIYRLEEGEVDGI